MSTVRRGNTLWRFLDKQPEGSVTAPIRAGYGLLWNYNDKCVGFWSPPPQGMPPNAKPLTFSGTFPTDAKHWIAKCTMVSPVNTDCMCALAGSFTVHCIESGLRAAAFVVTTTGFDLCHVSEVFESDGDRTALRAAASKCAGACEMLGWTFRKPTTTYPSPDENPALLVISWDESDCYQALHALYTIAHNHEMTVKLHCSTT